eukprot:scaffold1915_cov37-Prasinocladus_malaysianus.AAC.1
MDSTFPQFPKDSVRYRTSSRYEFFHSYHSYEYDYWYAMMERCTDSDLTDRQNARLPLTQAVPTASHDTRHGQPCRQWLIKVEMQREWR